MTQEMKVFLAALKSITPNVRLGTPAQLLILAQRLQRVSAECSQIGSVITIRKDQTDMQFSYFASEMSVIQDSGLSFSLRKKSFVSSYTKKREFFENLSKFISDIEKHEQGND